MSRTWLLPPLYKTAPDGDGGRSAPEPVPMSRTWLLLAPPMRVSDDADEGGGSAREIAGDAVNTALPIEGWGNDSLDNGNGSRGSAQAPRSMESVPSF